MGLVETLSWAVVELQGARPDIQAVKSAIELAFIEAAKLNIRHEVRGEHLIRLAAVHGGY